MMIDYIIGLIGITLTCVLILFGYKVYEESKKPTFSLIKDQWSCTETHTYTYVINIPVGKVLIPQVQYETICDNYKRIK